MDFELKVTYKAIFSGLLTIWAVNKICKAVRNVKKDVYVFVVNKETKPSNKKEKVESK